MLTNKKGFTLIELLAVIMISTIIFFPMLNSLISNYQVNSRMHQRKAASSMTITTMHTFDKMDFNDLISTIYDARDIDQYYVELTVNDCALIDSSDPTFDYPYWTNTELCTYIFEQSWNNMSYGDDDFKVFLLPYHLDMMLDTDQTKREWLLAQTDLPEAVRREIELIETTTRDNQEIIRIIVWIRYDERTGSVITSNGVINRAVN